MADNKKSAREKAAAARAEALAKEKRRDRMVKIIIAVVVVVVVGGIIGGAIVVSRNTAAQNNPDPSADAKLPTGVNSEKYFYQVNQNPPAGAPAVTVYEDFQCPHCKSFEEASGQQLIDAAKAGTINLQWQPGIFMDANLQNSGSQTATAAWGCAIDAGKATEFHQGVFAEQPAQEVPGNPGFTVQQMLTLGSSVGITGDAYNTFESCVNAKTYYGWVANSNAQFEKDNVSSTPTIMVNGKPLDSKTVNFNDPAALLKAIEAAKS